jgi:hypothetical protein
MALLVALAVLACVVTGSAIAYWTASGSGTASAATGTLQPVTVTALAGGDTPTSVLLPGATGDVILRISNPNSSAVTLTSVTGNGTITADAGHPTCTTTGVSFTSQTGMSTSIAASSTTLVHLPGAASMSTASSNGCQGATFSIPVAVTVHLG